MEMKFWGFCGKNMPSLLSGSIWPYVEWIALIEKYMLQNLSKFVSHFSLSIISNKRSMISLRYLNLLVLMQILITVTMKKIRCELLTCWLPIMSRKPTKKRIKIKKEISLRKPHYCIQQLTRLSCMTRYVLSYALTAISMMFLIFIFAVFFIIESFARPSLFLPARRRQNGAS